MARCRQRLPVLITVFTPNTSQSQKNSIRRTRPLSSYTAPTSSPKSRVYILYHITPLTSILLFLQQPSPPLLLYYTLYLIRSLSRLQMSQPSSTNNNAGSCPSGPFCPSLTTAEEQSRLRNDRLNTANSSISAQNVTDRLYGDFTDYDHIENARSQLFTFSSRFDAGTQNAPKKHMNN
ncbi:hypothetical protein GGS23DRAFT_565535 [Durotheca rogersii]|uniref:uncharacterized protein n=1 Tax=Durotheca rogersii TaxID=419775 RepID=UPI00221F8670|nr:uncharacterized protein GGS23DRAFT_565535 [Durotheca rogersii]KAI5863813.1 hypothetical protein GGS23DRAFT_565535 [Durotheca rogersii]